MIIKSCEYCGKEIYPSKNKIKFCSISCSNRFNKTKINETVLRKLYLQGYTREEIANQLGFHKQYIGKLIRQLPEYTKRSSAEIQHQNTLNKREQSFAQTLKDKGYDYEYVSGYKNNISPVNLKCKRCGEIVTFNAHFIHKNKQSRHSCCIQKRDLYSDLIKIIMKRYSQEKKKAKLKAKADKITIKECIECGTEFITSNKRVVCCSRKCSKRRQNRLKEISRRHKLRENGTVDYSISLHRLIKKHKGKCAICGKRVDIKADPNSDMYPSIDHVFPVMKGGTHTWDNVQLAHRGCNSDKNDKVLIEEANGQLRLCL